MGSIPSNKPRMGGVGTWVINAVVAFSAPKAAILEHPIGLESSPSKLERALSTAQLPIVTTTTWLLYQVNG